MTVLRNLCRSLPEVGWGIVLGLLPELHQTFMDSSKPSYRDWSAGWEGNIAGEDYRTCIATAVDLAVSLASSDPHRWTVLIDRMGPMFFYSHLDYTRLRNELETFIKAGTSGEVREKLWEHLRKFVEDHTNFRTADWALPESEIEHLAILRDSLRPEDLVASSVHWFDDDGYMDDDETLTYEQKAQRRTEKRRKVITAIWSAGGIQEVMRLAKRVRTAGIVGWTLGEAMGGAVEAGIVPALFDCRDAALEFFSCVYAHQRIHTEGFSWAISMPTPNWTTAQLTVWVLEMPYTADNWDWIESRDPAVARAYWAKIRPWGGADVELHIVQRAIRHLLDANRVWVALDYVMGRQLSKRDVTAEMVYEVLEALTANPGDDERDTMDRHHVHQAFRFLHDSGDEDELRLARLEYSFLPFLDHFSPVTPKTLERNLATDPTFFIECLCAVFRARSEPKGGDVEHPDEDSAKEEANGTRARKAQVIFNLLRNWRTIPGLEEDGTISTDKLRSWVTSARELARNADRIEVCDVTIGELFAKPHADSDGALPLIPIREIIEECASEDLERGFYIGLFNRRGVVSKAVYEGGQKERELAAQYDHYAQICSPWPRTAAVLRDMGRGYQRRAQREDEEAEARK